MAWSVPMTAVAGSVFTAAQFNTYVRDNLLETGPSLATAAGQVLVANAANSLRARLWSTASVTGSTETTTSTTYTDLATAGPTVTRTTGTIALVAVSCRAQSSSATENAQMGVAVSGASSVSASNGLALTLSGTAFQASTYLALYTGLTAGSNVFTAKYAASAGTAGFAARRIIVMPLS